MDSVAMQSTENPPAGSHPSNADPGNHHQQQEQQQTTTTAQTASLPPADPLSSFSVRPQQQPPPPPLPTRPQAPLGIPPINNPPPPFHHFRVDSQTSSNSFVLKSNPSFYSASGQTTPQHLPHHHYRFPSLESMGANSQGSGLYPEQFQQQQQQLPRANHLPYPPQHQHQQNYPQSIGIHNLPYHERRRLYNQRKNGTSESSTSEAPPVNDQVPPPPPPVAAVSNIPSPPSNPPPPQLVIESPMQQRYHPPYSNPNANLMMAAPPDAFGFSPVHHADRRHMYPPSPGSNNFIYHQPFNHPQTTNIPPPPPPPPYPWPSAPPAPMNHNMYGNHSANPFPQPPQFQYQQQQRQQSPYDSSLEDYSGKIQPIVNGLDPRLSKHEFSDESSSSSGMDDFGSTSEDSQESVLSSTPDPQSNTTSGGDSIEWDETPPPTERTNLLPPRPSDSTRETVRTKGGRRQQHSKAQQDHHFYWSTSGDGSAKRSKSTQGNEQEPNQSKSIIQKTTSVWKKLHQRMNWAQALVANLPLTIGGLAYSFACMGVVWFKFAEENLDTCVPVHFHSPNCSYPEFPGCFECDTSVYWYNAAYYFHMACSGFAGILAMSFFAKLIFAPRVVWDELSNPTTATPAGLICMTLDVVFAGRGLLGELAVVSAGSIHLCLAVWFIYMTLVYHIMPQPSWFPNTVGIGLSAVKTWLYFPMAGHFLMAISLSLNFLFFPISLIRVFINRKIAATVGWMQQSAPNVSLYALTIMAQPSFMEEHPDVTRFQIVHRMVYLPCMHFLFGMCLLGMAASIHSLVVRWKEFRRMPFSPAHVAFCAPTLSHANAVQAYRGAVDSFSAITPGSPIKITLYCYWVIVLGCGTLVTFVIAFKFLSKLPEWTHIDTEGEIEPPAPSETAMTSNNLLATGETMVQPFVSPAILQANEAGALVLASDALGSPVYRRTRKITALGFEPIMTDLQMEVERELLLEYVARNPPRQRHRTVSAVPAINTDDDDDTDSGIFGFGAHSPFARRPRANTSSPYVTQGRKKASSDGPPPLPFTPKK